MPADPYRLDRFLAAQAEVYAQATRELRAGRKQTHWMWFVFPQLAGLGSSATARRYAIGSADEARAYLSHPVLGPRLGQCVQLLLALQGVGAQEVFGSPDDLKLRSCLTLFATVGGADSVFRRALERYFGGECDPRTVALLATAPALPPTP